MSHMYCCAKWCSTSGKSGGHFFSVPADHRFSTWLKYANRLELLLTPRAKVHKTYRLCSKHFTRDCFTSDTRTRLTREAVPSVKVQEPRLRALVHPDFYDERVAQGIGSTAPSQSQPSTAPVEVMLGHDYLPLPPMLEPGTVAGADSAVHDTGKSSTVKPLRRGTLLNEMDEQVRCAVQGKLGQVLPLMKFKHMDVHGQHLHVEGYRHGKKQQYIQMELR
ncbi:uncharacterized protein LOC144107553 isoform X1 [Amblyomma americanum]